MGIKTQQLQIRVSPEQKHAIRRLAKRSGQDLSTYVLARALPTGSCRFAEILHGMDDTSEDRFWLAELNDFLAGLAPVEFTNALQSADMGNLSSHQQNYVAAMVELAAHQKKVDPPTWTRDVEPLEEPYFAVPFPSLKPHLLTAAPVAFKRRNLFVDSSVGSRI